MTEPRTARDLVDEQAEDEGLWFVAQTAPEAYLQQELRRLHAAIEEEASSSDDLRAALERKHEKVCSCPFDGTDPDCNLSVSGTWIAAALHASRLDADKEGEAR
jgi:hypothetical protein